MAFKRSAVRLRLAPPKFSRIISCLESRAALFSLEAGRHQVARLGLRDVLFGRAANVPGKR